MSKRARRLRTWAIVALVGLVAISAAASVPFVQKWSPRNHERPKRITTSYIILHTTEGPAQGSLQKLYDNGEANFFVDPIGKIFATIDRRRVAYHCGRSMWRGRTNLDDVSIGIEVSGYHTRDMTSAQYASLRALLSELQTQYNIPDENVLTHSMVAYGAPNRWHRRSHRGRKRCGMLFATDNVRNKLGLTSRPLYDPDVRSGRLAVGDPYLSSVLYAAKGAPRQLPAQSQQPITPTSAAHPPVVASSPSPSPTPAPSTAPAAAVFDEEVDVITVNRSAWDVARDQYNDPGTRYVFPDGKSLMGNQVRDWKMVPPGTRVFVAASDRDNQVERVLVLGRDGMTAREIAGDEFNTTSTIYFLADGRVRTGAEVGAEALDKLPAGTAMLVGYVRGGAISAKRRAFDVCGVKWNHPSTFYRMPDDGKLVSGAILRENAIPKGAQVFFRN